MSTSRRTGGRSASGCRSTGARNYVGTIFGGSMYGAVDPVFRIMLIKLLGPGYEIWDKAATIQFRKPGRSTLRATFRIGAEERDAIRAAVARDGTKERPFDVGLTDGQGQVCFSCEKLLSILRRDGNRQAGR